MYIVPTYVAVQLHINISLNRHPDRLWRRPPGRPRNKWLDQLRNDSTRPTGDLWRRAVDRGRRLRDNDDDGGDAYRRHYESESHWSCLFTTVEGLLLTLRCMCVSESAPPPSYNSVFKRVQASRQQSTSKTEFVKSLPATICAGTGTYVACVWLIDYGCCCFPDRSDSSTV